VGGEGVVCRPDVEGVEEAGEYLGLVEHLSAPFGQWHKAARVFALAEHSTQPDVAPTRPCRHNIARIVCRDKKTPGLCELSARDLV
jgi:hypothetical protein